MARAMQSLSFSRERGECRERTGHVERRGKHAGVHFATAALGIEEEETVEEFDFVGGAYTTVEIFEIGAAAEGYVLAVVDVFAVGQAHRTWRGRRGKDAARTTGRASPLQPARRRLPSPPGRRRLRSHFSRIFSSVTRPKRAWAMNSIFRRARGVRDLQAQPKIYRRSSPRCEDNSAMLCRQSRVRTVRERGWSDGRSADIIRMSRL